LILLSLQEEAKKEELKQKENTPLSAREKKSAITFSSDVQSEEDSERYTHSLSFSLSHNL
jgi:hypothetical protein